MVAAVSKATFQIHAWKVFHYHRHVVDITTHLNFDNQFRETEEWNLSKFYLYNFQSDKIDWEIINRELTDIKLVSRAGH